MKQGVQHLKKWFVGGFVTSVVLYASCLIALRIMGFEYAVIVSNSMLPIAARGDLVLVTATNGLKPDDVILFRRGSTLILHRLVEQQSDGTWLTKGDANEGLDPWFVSPGDIVGEAAGVLRGFGTPLLLMSRNSAAAEFATSANASGSVGSGFWINPVMTYTTYSGLSNVSITGNSNVSTETSTTERRIFASTTYPGVNRIRFNGLMTRVDSTIPGMYLVARGCANTNNTMSCGIHLFLHSPTKTAILKAYTANGSLVTTPWSCTHTKSLTSTFVASLHLDADKLTVFVGGSVCMQVPNVSSVVTAAGGAALTGNRVGVGVSINNRFSASIIAW